ncbi:MAG TPA: hypothetical protein VFF73_31065, partial [Planctomycetota bacterium]|nr:hypothetical protein [Planctomycetota bacterium]
MARSRAALVVLGLTATFAPGDAASSPGVDTAPALVAARRASLERSLGAFAARIASRTTLSPGAEQARAALELARRRGKSLDLVAYRATLTAILRTSVDAAHELAHCLRELGRADATLAFSTALALAPWVDAGAAETLLDGLANEADPRPALVVALRGSAEPRVDRALVALYEADPDTA